VSISVVKCSWVKCGEVQRRKDVSVFAAHFVTYLMTLNSDRFTIFNILPAVDVYKILIQRT